MTPFAGVSKTDYAGSNAFADPNVRRRELEVRGGVQVDLPLWENVGLAAQLQYATVAASLRNDRTSNLSVLFGPTLRYRTRGTARDRSPVPRSALPRTVAPRAVAPPLRPSAGGARPRAPAAQLRLGRRRLRSRRRTGAVNPAATAAAGAQRVLELGPNVIFRERVTTSTGGTAQLIFVNKTTLSIGPNASVVIDEFVYNPSAGTGAMAVSLARGIVRFVGGNTSHTGGATVTTPVATIGIRGGIATVRTAPRAPSCTSAT